MALLTQIQYTKQQSKQVIIDLIPLLLAIASLFSMQSMANDSIAGQWTTIDDSTGQPKSIVAIQQDGNVFSGKIIKLINPSENNPLCSKCKGDKANQPILGLTILWDVKQQQNHYKGSILDPKKGKTYKLKLTLIENGEKLKVRGYIGTPLLGRTQVWIRTTQ